MHTSSQKPRSESRRVQWLDHTSPPPAHLLDEYGLDIQAFQSLTTALEEHKRAPLGQVHYYPPEPHHQLEHQTQPQQPPSPSPDTPTHSLSGLEIDSSFIPLLPNPASGPGSGRHTPYASSSAASSTSSVNGHEEISRARVLAHLRSRKRAQSALANAKIRFTGDNDHRGDVENPPPMHTSKGILSTLLDLYTPLQSGYNSDASLSAIPSSSSSSLQKKGKQKQAESQPPQPQPQPKPKSSHHIHIPRPNLNLNLNLITRPSQARTSGGVVGALIASTGNIAGWAAPTPSTVQPDLKRPGFRLTRYISESVPTLSTLRPALVRRASDSATSTLFPSPDHQNQTPNENKEKERERDETPPPPPSPVIPSHWGWRKSWSSLPSDKEKEKAKEREKEREGGNKEREKGEEKEKRHSRRPRKKRMKEDIYITQNLSALLARQSFLLTLARTMMKHGAPPHRLPAQLTSAARVLGIELNVFYLPDIMLLSFDDATLGTSQIKMIRQGSVLDLGRLGDAYEVYWKVIHDTLPIPHATQSLTHISTKPPPYNTYTSILLGGLCASSICTVSFSGSFLDALTSFPMGCLLVAVQMLSQRNVLYSYVFEVTITTLLSLLSALLASTHTLCYSAILSSSVVLILPGFLVLTGSLELLSRHIVSGSVRICYAVFYALILGFGFTIGAQIYGGVSKKKVYGLEDYSCSMSHDPLGGWYQRTPSKLWAFLTVPLFSLFLSLRNFAPYNRKELPMLVLIACIGWVTNYFTGTHFVQQTDITAAVGAFAVGLVSNLCSRFFKGNAFVIMITGILFQLPSGLGTGGLLSYASEQTGGSPDSYLAGFRSALKLVSVAIGLAIGLGLSLSVTHPIQSKRREAGIFSL